MKARYIVKLRNRCYGVVQWWDVTCGIKPQPRNRDFEHARVSQDSVISKQAGALQTRKGPN